MFLFNLLLLLLASFFKRGENGSYQDLCHEVLNGLFLLVPDNNQ